MCGGLHIGHMSFCGLSSSFEEKAPDKHCKPAAAGAKQCFWGDARLLKDPGRPLRRVCSHISSRDALSSPRRHSKGAEGQISRYQQNSGSIWRVSDTCREPHSRARVCVSVSCVERVHLNTHTHIFKCGCVPHNAQTQINIRLSRPANTITCIDSHASPRSKNKIKRKVVDNTRKTGGSRGGDDKPECFFFPADRQVPPLTEALLLIIN